MKMATFSWCVRRKSSKLSMLRLVHVLLLQPLFVVYDIALNLSVYQVI